MSYTTQELSEMRQDGMTYGQMEQLTGIPKGTIHSRIGGLTIQNPDFTTIPEFEGDCIVVGDVHVPTTDWEFASYVRIVGERDLRHKVPKTLIICGDLFNFDAVSAYDSSLPENDLTTEIKLAKALLDDWAKTFGQIILTMGNHERRLFAKLRGVLGAENFSDLLGGKAEVYRSGSINITSGGVEWRAIHPRNYSRNPGLVGDRLAQKYQCNVIVHHEHHAGIRRDSYNRYTVINNGGLHDSRSMWYVQEFDNTSPEMQNSFVSIVNGVGKLFTPYDSMTDWSPYGDFR